MYVRVVFGVFRLLDDVPDLLSIGLDFLGEERVAVPSEVGMLLGLVV